MDAYGILNNLQITRWPRRARRTRRKAQILASGVGVTWAPKAQRLLDEEWGVAADGGGGGGDELRRQARAADERAPPYPEEEARVPYVTQTPGRHRGPGCFVVLSSWMCGRGAKLDRASGYCWSRCRRSVTPRWVRTGHPHTWRGAAVLPHRRRVGGDDGAGAVGQAR